MTEATVGPWNTARWQWSRTHCCVSSPLRATPMPETTAPPSSTTASPLPVTPARVTLRTPFLPKLHGSRFSAPGCMSTQGHEHMARGRPAGHHAPQAPSPGILVGPGGQLQVRRVGSDCGASCQHGGSKMWTHVGGQTPWAAPPHPHRLAFCRQEDSTLRCCAASGEPAPHSGPGSPPTTPLCLAPGWRAPDRPRTAGSLSWSPPDGARGRSSSSAWVPRTSLAEMSPGAPPG